MAFSFFAQNTVYLPVGLSLLLPGLGQLFQRQRVLALIYFVPFAFCLFYLDRLPAQWGLLLLPMISAVAAGLTARREGALVSSWPRSAAFAAASLFCFFVWVVPYFSLTSGFGVKAQLNEDAENLSRAVRQFYDDNKHWPTESELPAIWQATKDPWSQPYRYERLDPGFAIRSFGRDKIAETPDDSVYHYAR